MGVSDLILGRPWLYNHDTILFGLPNSCSFHHPRNEIESNPTPLKDDIRRDFSTLTAKDSDLNPITTKDSNLSEAFQTITISGHPSPSKTQLSFTLETFAQRPSSTLSEYTLQDGYLIEDDIRRNSFNPKERRFELNLIITKELDYGETVPIFILEPSNILSPYTLQDDHLVKDNNLCTTRALFRGFLVWKVPWPLLGTFI